MAPKRKRDLWQREIPQESSFTNCPACQMKVVCYLINQHLDCDCLALTKNTKQHLTDGVAETTGAFSKSSEGISEATSCDIRIQQFKKRVEDRSEAEFSNYHCNHKLDAEDKECLIFVPQEKNFQFQHAQSLEEKLQDPSSAKSTAFKLNAHSSDELGSKRHGGQPDASSEFQSNTDPHGMKEGKQFCTAFPMTSSASEVELEVDNFDCNLEINKSISSCVEDVICGKVDSVNASHSQRKLQSSAEASTVISKSRKKDGWGFITASLPSKFPKGHYVIENFISEKEEQELVSFLDMDIKNPWKVKAFNGLHLGKAYGLSPDLKKRCICPAAFEMPKILVPLIERMRTNVPTLKDFWPNETNAIDYCKDKGHWLKPHVDDRQLSGTVLVNLSLCGDCKMTYERERGPRESYKVLLRRRCIQIQTGECRYSFTHSILNKDLLASRRVSMTFRQSLGV